MTQKLKKSLRKLNKEKQDKPILYSGELGVPLNGSKTVEVPNRKGFVFVRLKGNSSELIQAHNAVVSPVYGLPVLIGRKGSIYQVIGHNVDTYKGIANTPYLPRHGSQHSFNHNLGIGGDIVWTYSQQFMPLLSYPSGTNGSMTIGVEPHFYEWQGWRYMQNTGTPDYSPYLPSAFTGGSGAARMVLSYIDPSDNSIKLVPGTPFDASITGSAQVAQYIPDIPRSIGIPLAAVRLTTGTTQIGWDAIYDMRDFYTVGSIITGTVASVDTIGFAGLDEGVPLGTGTMLNVTGDLSFTRSGTVFNLSYAAGGGPGGGGGVGVMAWDEGVPLATGTVFNFVGSPVTATASGAVIRVEVNPSPFLGYSSIASGTYASLTSTSMADVDATYAAVTFSAPPSGKVLVRLTASCSAGVGSDYDILYWGLREGSSDIAGPYIATRGRIDAGAASVFGATAVFVITGISAGSHTYKWSYKVSAGTSTIFAVSSNPAVMEVCALN